MSDDDEAARINREAERIKAEALATEMRTMAMLQTQLVVLTAAVRAILTTNPDPAIRATFERLIVGAQTHPAYLSDAESAAILREVATTIFRTEPPRTE